MTDSNGDYSRLVDEPSRALRVFPGQGTGASQMILHEDDGISADGHVTEVSIRVAWTPDEIEVAVSIRGDYRLPYEEMRIVLPERENRPLKLVAETAWGRGVQNLKLIS
jgi:hypothetical protein